MKESVFLVTDVHKACIQSGHQFLDTSQIHIAHRERNISSFALKFHQALIFEKGDGDLFGLYVNY
jgi:hypothetical protein